MTKRFFGFQGSAQAWLTSRVHLESKRLAIVCPDRKTASEVSEDLRFYSNPKSVIEIPPWDFLPFENVSPSMENSASRIAAFNALQTLDSFIAVVPIETLMQRTIPHSVLNNLNFNLEVGSELPRNSLLKQFDSAGFTRVSLVENIGEFTARGQVVDFFPINSNSPIRLSFRGDTLERIKIFDTDSQRSLSEIMQFMVFPARESLDLRSYSDFPEKISRLRARAKELETPAREVSQSIDALEQGLRLPGIEQLQAIALGPLSPMLDAIPKDTKFILLDEITLQTSADEFWNLAKEREQRLAGDHYLIPSVQDLYQEPKQCLDSITTDNETSYFDELEILNRSLTDEDSNNIRSYSNSELTTQLKAASHLKEPLAPLKAFIAARRSDGYNIGFIAGSEGRIERLQRALLNLGIDAHHLPTNEKMSWIKGPRRFPVCILQGHLRQGLQLPNEKLVIISESEVFAERSYRKRQTSSQSIKRLLSSLSQLKEDDYIVHNDFGIGIYRGLRHMTIEGAESDFLQIDYADSRLYLPVQSIGKVQRFTASGDQKPVLDKLGSKKWSRTKAKVRQAVISLAGDLIKLYAARSIGRGWRFDSIGAEDERFADEFAYDETPDQKTAIEEALIDMASERPMDRLICGDVGFGKTEVALRAAYKCLQHAKQVAVLVPTTILAEQHKKTFEARFVDYPFRVGTVSRFYKAAENKETLEKLASGDIDIIIGTHRLLSRDVEFGDLGLLIVDEEHRFGVKQKEKLKAFKKSVDVLTLTATPIPRTLHMSMLEIRDISVISTPPHDRKATRTYVATESEVLIRDAILRELKRGGQVFFVHNRVQSIEAVAARLVELLPEARFDIGHGQMSERQLEGVMTRFMNHETDVLISTTIVESGLDIPNANTLIVDRADTFGLAQLYQLRGRVGRSDKHAYAYFLVPSSRKKLGTEAQQRLKVLQSLDDLGVGFNLAIRDMEIRGAGNLLGKEQSGSVLAVGFDMYCKILKEAVANLKGEDEDVEEFVDPEVKFGIDAYIPDYYIPDISERLVLYQRLADIRKDAEAAALAEEIEDRFGYYGVETENLIQVMKLRGLLRRSGIERAEIVRDRLLLSIHKRAPLNIERVFELVKSDPDKYRFGKNLTLSTKVDFGIPPDAQKLFHFIDSLIQRLQK